jgi:hypothetical protein
VDAAHGELGHVDGAPEQRQRVEPEVRVVDRQELAPLGVHQVEPVGRPAEHAGVERVDPEPAPGHPRLDRVLEAGGQPAGARARPDPAGERGARHERGPGDEPDGEQPPAAAAQMASPNVT